MEVAKLTNIVFRDVRGARVNLPAVAEPTIRRSLFRILGRNVLCSIATVTPRHRPHINTAYFSYSSELVLYFLSHPDAQHCRNLARHPSVGVTIFSSAQPWGTPGQGVQLFGICRRARGFHVRQAERLYAKRFPAHESWRTSADRDRTGSEYRFFRLVVNSLKLLDERAIGDAVFTHAAVSRTRGREVRSRERRPTRG